MLPELDAIAEIVVETLAAVIAPLQADLVATKAALAALQATIAGHAEDVAPLDRRVAALLADVGTVRERVAAVEVKTLQPGPQGPPGKDGTDGLGFDELDCVDDGASVVLQFRLGETVKSFPLPIPYDRGTYKPEETYAKGACITDNGYWIAKAATKGIRPGNGPTSWRLVQKSVK